MNASRGPSGDRPPPGSEASRRTRGDGSPGSASSPLYGVTDEDFRRHAMFREALRRFTHFSDDLARQAGLTPTQHQLLLAIRSAPQGWLSVGDVARTMVLQPHSALGLVERALAAGLVERHEDPDDHRRVRVTLTDRGREVVARLVSAHRPELMRLWDQVSPP